MKIILVIIGLLLAAFGGGYIYFSQKPIQINIQLPPSPAPAGGEVAPSVLAPSAGKDIVITHCKGEPQILQAHDGMEINFINADDKEHTIYNAGANTKITLPARGSAKFVAMRPANIPKNLDFTDNYVCDSTSFSGAIYLPAQ